MYVYVHIDRYIYIYCTHIYIHIYIHIIYICTDIYTYLHTYIHIYIYTYTHIHIYTYVHIPIYKYTYKYIYIYICLSIFPGEELNFTFPSFAPPLGVWHLSRRRWLQLQLLPVGCEKRWRRTSKRRWREGAGGLAVPWCLPGSLTSTSIRIRSVKKCSFQFFNIMICLGDFRLPCLIAER